MGTITPPISLLAAVNAIKAAEQIDIVCHDGMTAELAAAMDALYAHLYASPRYFEAAQALQGAQVYVASRAGRPLAILPYHHARGEVTVASEYMTVEAAEIERFARHMFARHRDVRRVVFPRVCAQPEGMRLPWHALVASEDMVVHLPPTVKDYEAAIGKNTRRNIKRYTSALQKDFPSYRYDLYLESDIREQDVRDIIALSVMRMKSKNIVPRFNETEVNWIVDFAKTNGIVGVARIDGEVAAGAIGFRIGDHYFMHVIAHHPKYNDYSLGILCYYHTLCEGIVRGARRFHLLNGRYGYKYRLLAQCTDVIHLDVYRSRFAALLQMPRIARKEAKGRVWRLKQWLLHDLERIDKPGYRELAKLVQALRRAKRARGGGDDAPDH